MRKVGTLLLWACLLALCLTRPAAAQGSHEPFVRLAELDVVASQLDDFTAAARLHLQAALEIYADEAAYRSHVSSPHFLKYVAATKPMITARALHETLPIGLNLKPQ